MATAITTSGHAPLAWLPLLSLLLPVPASALEWLVQPSLRLRETYTDNALRTPNAQAQSDFITEIAPAIALIGSGPRLRVHLDYSWHKYLST